MRCGWFWDELVKEHGLDKNGVLRPLDVEVRVRAAYKGFRERVRNPGLAGADAKVYED